MRRLLNVVALVMESENLKEDDCTIIPVDEGYRGKLYQSMNRFRKEKILCDTVLVVEGQKFHAHRNILAASSPYFLGLFTSELKVVSVDDVIQAVELDGFEENIMEDLLDYIYTGEARLSEENVRELVFAADFLLINDLKTKGSEFMEANLTPENCLSVRAFAEKYNCKKLLIKAEDFIIEKFIEVSRSEEFLLLEAEQLEQLISCDDIVVESEEEVYEGVVSWVKQDTGQRKTFFPSLFSRIRLSCISKYYLAEVVEKEELVMNSSECVKLLYQAMKSYALPKQSNELGLVTKPRTSACNYVDAIVTIWGPGDELRSSTQCFIPSENRWYSLAPMLIPRFSHGAVHCEGFIYTVGGVSLNGHLSSMERYDYRTNTWSGVAPMNKEVSALGVAELNGLLYTVGGWNRGKPLSNVSRYNPQTNKWQEVAPLTTSRGGPCVIANKHLYAIGGKTEHHSDHDVCVYLSTVEKYDPRENKWTAVPSLQTRRAYAGGVAVNRKLFVIGGTQDDLLSSHNSCEVFDTETQTWSFIGNLIVPRALCGVVFVGGNIYVLGGKKNCRERTSKVECYDFELNVWRVLGSVPNCIGGIQCCSVMLSKEMVYNLPKIS